MFTYTLFTKADCQWCDKAKQLLTSQGLSYTEFDIVKHPVLADVLKSMGLSTVPQVFEDDYNLGGYEDTKRWLEDTDESMYA